MVRHKVDAPDCCGWGLGLGLGLHPGRRCARQDSGCLSCSGGEGTIHRCNQVRAFVEDPKTGTTGNAGPVPYRAAGSMSSIDGESTHPGVGQTQCDQNTANAPHTERCLPAAPLPPRSRTELANLNKRPPPPACVRAEIRH